MKKTAVVAREKFTMEFMIKSSPEFLYTYISAPSNLSEWFADDVRINGDIFTFEWEGSEEKARLLGKRMNKFVKFQWLDKSPEEYFSFEIDQDDLTGDVALIVTDFEEEGDISEAQMIYNVSVDKLRQTIGG